MSEFTPVLRDPSHLPDVSYENKAHVLGLIDRVGMEKIEMPIRYKLPTGEVALIPALIDAYVSLDKEDAKGIHMSRLYLNLKDQLAASALNATLIDDLLQSFINGHKGLSESSYVKINFQLPVLRKALVSEEEGWRHYNVFIQAQKTKQRLSYVLGGEVLYSSTCPCSAALARQLNQEAFLKKFGLKDNILTHEVSDWLMTEGAVAATPHAQRSVVKFKVKCIDEKNTPTLIELIDQVEEALKTPVQAAVKRADEQEFARLNASNLMFCEDAGRILKTLFDADSRFSDFWAHISHEESLHPHNATSYISKGVLGGWQ